MAREKVKEVGPREYTSHISEMNLQSIAETLTDLRKVTVSEFSTDIEKDMARAKLSLGKDILTRFGFMVTFTLRGKCEITLGRPPLSVR